MRRGAIVKGEIEHGSRVTSRSNLFGRRRRPRGKHRRRPRAGLARQAHQDRDSLSRRRLGRFVWPRVRRPIAGAPQATRGDRQSRWRGRQCRRQHGREVARRWLHAVAAHQRAGHQSGDLQVAALRPGGRFRARGRAGDHLDRDRRQQQAADQDISGIRRLREGQPRQDELWLDRRRQRAASDDGDGQARDRHRHRDGALHGRRAAVHRAYRRRNPGGAGADDRLEVAYRRRRHSRHRRHHGRARAEHADHSDHRRAGPAGFQHRGLAGAFRARRHAARGGRSASARIARRGQIEGAEGAAGQPDARPRRRRTRRLRQDLQGGCRALQAGREGREYSLAGFRRSPWRCSAVSPPSAAR